MAETITIARPYAEAAFRLALSGNSLAAWSGMLERMATVAGHPDMQACIANPKLSGAQLIAIFESMVGEVTQEGKNFVQVLTENRRLQLLPQIRELFEELKQTEEGVIDARISSAFPLEGEQLKTLVIQLEAHFKRKIIPQVSLDQELIGGVKIEIGDEVIDASVRASLQAMAGVLKH